MLQVPLRGDQGAFLGCFECPAGIRGGLFGISMGVCLVGTPLWGAQGAPRGCMECLGDQGPLLGCFEYPTGILGAPIWDTPGASPVWDPWGTRPGCPGCPPNLGSLSEVQPVPIWGPLGARLG